MGCFVRWYHSAGSPTGLSTSGFQLNRAYQVRNPILLRQFMQVRLLERNFESITFNHIPRNQSSLTDAYANYILDWHLTHFT